MLQQWQFFEHPKLSANHSNLSPIMLMIYQLTALPGSPLTWLKANKWSVPVSSDLSLDSFTFTQFLKTKEKADWDFTSELILILYSPPLTGTLFSPKYSERDWKITRHKYCLANNFFYLITLNILIVKTLCLQDLEFCLWQMSIIWPNQSSLSNQLAKSDVLLFRQMTVLCIHDLHQATLPTSNTMLPSSQKHV